MAYIVFLAYAPPSMDLFALLDALHNGIDAVHVHGLCLVLEAVLASCRIVFPHTAAQLQVI